MNHLINRNRSILSSTAIIGSAQYFLIVYMISSTFSKEIFGFYILLSQSLIVCQAGFMVLFTNGLLKFWIEANYENRGVLLGTVYSVILSICISFSILMLINSEKIANLMPTQIQSKMTLLLIFLLLVIVTTLKSITVSINNIMEKPEINLYHKIATGVVCTTLVAYTIYLRDHDIVEVIGMALLSDIICLPLLFLKVWRQITPVFRFVVLQRLFGYSAPLVIASLAVVLSQNIDKYLIAGALGYEAVAAYGLAAIIGNTFAVGITSHMAAYLPPMRRLHSLGSYDEFRILWLFYRRELQLLLIIGATTIAIIGKPSLYYFLPEYVGTNILIIAVVMIFMQAARANYLFYKQILLVKDATFSILILEVFALILTLILIPITLMVGSVILVAACVLSIMIILNFAAHKLVRRYSLSTTDGIDIIQGLLFYCIIFLSLFLEKDQVFYVNVLLVLQLLWLCFQYYKKHKVK
jgi:O-antigen/teichoic acid export membrane protein